MNKISTSNSERSYFTITPRLVWALCEDPHEFALWHTIKTIAGEEGECYIRTSKLAILSMMSGRTVARKRIGLIEKGLIVGEKVTIPDSEKTVWHLRIPDLWQENIRWSMEHLSLADRIEWKKQQKEGKFAPKERTNAEGIATGASPPMTEWQVRYDRDAGKEEPLKKIPLSKSNGITEKFTGDDKPEEEFESMWDYEFSET